MTPEETQTMETLLDLFNHEGWKIFIEDQETLSKQLKDQAYRECNTNEEWQIRRGVLLDLDRVLTYEDMTKYVYENQEDSNEL